jgi:serine/threonine-protein kinase RsbW
MRFDLHPGPDAHEDRCLAWMERVAERVTQEGSARGLGEDAAYFLGAAVREALLNAFCHGRDACGQPWVSVRVNLLRDTLVLTVRDHGPGFDPDLVADPCCPENYTRGHGRGLFFMRQFSDRVSFAFPTPGGSRVRLEKRIPVRS